MKLAQPLPIVSAALVAALASRAQAFQCDNFGPVSADFRVNQSSAYDQIWGRVARSPLGFTFTWSAGQDVFARRYNTSMAPISGDYQVNTTLTNGTQDEPDVAYSIYGNSMIAWSDRNAYDGQGMGIFGRFYGANGVPLGPEVQINANGAASQWRPLIVPAPSGGFVVAWSGDWDGDSFLRIFDSTGNPQTGDIQVNQFEDNAQVDPAPAVNSAGTIFVAFIDFSSHGGVGTLFNLWGRTFTSTGVPITNEFPITTTTGDGHQKDPRVAADGLGRFIVVWETDIHDGSGYGIYARRYGTDSLPLGPEFLVNTTTSGDQYNPAVAAQTDGSFIVMWNDASTANIKIRAQRFDPNALKVGSEFTVNNAPNNGVDRPCIAMKANGTDLVVAFAGPGDGTDIYAKRFSVATGPTAYGNPVTHSGGCGASLTFSGTPSATNPSPFLITANNVLNQSIGTMYYSQTSAFTPFIGETLLLAMPAFRTGPLMSGGNTMGHDCSGSLAFDFNALIQSGQIPFLTAGTTVSAQFLFRDGQDPQGYGLGLTNALRFTICP